jgi:hypothetical protein
MLNKKILGAALVGALALGASAAAFATPVNVGGVVFDPDSPADLSIDALNFREGSISQVGDVLTGYGRIGSINGTDPDEFCPGCDLTFTFQYTVQSIDNVGGNTQIVFNAGTIQFYVDDTMSFNVLDPTTSGIGTEWLTMTGHPGSFTGYTLPDQAGGELYSTVLGTIAEPQAGSNGIGVLDATGGPVAGYFDTNTVQDGLGGFADFSINSSFLVKLIDGCTAGSPSPDPNDICHYPISGTAFVIGNSMLPVSVPEPGELGLLGLGLGALGFMVRRRRKEASRRA